VGILIAATVAAVLSVWIARLVLRSWKAWDTCGVRLFCACIFFSAAVNLAVKKPVIEGLLAAWGFPRSPAEWPWWFEALVLLIVGISEEGIKILPALVPAVRATVRSRGSAVPMAFTIGTGYAVGEIWYIAFRLYLTDPAKAGLPFYMFGPFVSERLATLLVHGFLVLISLRGLLLGRWRFALSIVAAMLAHAFANIGAALYQMKLVGMETSWLILLALTLVSAFAFWKYQRRVKPADRSELLSDSCVLFRRSASPDDPPFSQ